MAEAGRVGHSAGRVCLPFLLIVLIIRFAGAHAATAAVVDVTIADVTTGAFSVV